MGSQISVQEIEKKQESLNSILNNTLNKISTNISLKSENKQTVKIKADTLNISNKGKLNINQTASMNLDAFIKNVGETSSEVTQNVMNDFKIDDEFENIMEQSGIILGQSQISMQKEDIKQNFETIINSNVESSISSIISQEASNENIVFLDISNINIDNSEFIISQDSIIKMISDTASNSIVNSILDQISVNTATASTTMKNSMKQDGISIWAFGLLFLIPFVILGFIGIFIKAFFGIMFSVLCIILGSIIINQYNKSHYFYCENNASDTEHYIQTEYEAVPDDVYINPDFRESPSNERFNIPNGTGSPTIAYLNKEKQEEYFNLENKYEELDDEKENEKKKLKEKMTNITSNINNFVCVNGTKPLDDKNKSDDEILYMFKPKKFVLWLGIGLISIGIIILLISIYYLFKNKDQHIENFNNHIQRITRNNTPQEIEMIPVEQS